MDHINKTIETLSDDEFKIMVQIQKEKIQSRSVIMKNTRIPLTQFNTAINTLDSFGLIDKSTRYTGKRGRQAIMYYFTSFGDEIMKELKKRKIMVLS